MQSDVVPIGQLWKSIQHELFPELEEKQFVRVCELCAESLRKEIGQYEWQGPGRPSAERVFSHLEHYGAYAIYVCGTAKVMCHLMFAVLALTAHQLYQLII
ncbi:MAG: hypothetical protein KJ964_07225 [Verrucomicrobia bacterium]|nr:hypothetical protein [Verrucomicrobiota bacterium]MBU1735447.1 hypothetical protein [Verrucomicrobiota bacterium]MBU1856842.1 hypothetical protein [Verrucomicrobiota bacterium]